MTTWTIARMLAVAGFLASMGLMIWVMVGLARLRRHPQFRSPMAGSLRLHLMVLGAGTDDLDDATRAQIGKLRHRVLAAIAVFAIAAVVLMASAEVQAG